MKYFILALSALIIQICSTFYISSVSQSDVSMMLFFAGIGPFLSLPFIKYIEDSNISNLFEINIFNYDGIIPNGRTQHQILFPDNKEHLYILKNL